ncbi:MAG: creatininase family protein, partial [Barnesiella sp.]|nr:creatininase family protein [Barnesiella sp.]
GHSRTFAAETLRDGVAWVPRNWARISDDTGVGNPALATPEKGRRFAEAVVARYADLLRDLCAPSLY